jgi:hypothetical protein
MWLREIVERVSATLNLGIAQDVNTAFADLLYERWAHRE